MSDHTIGPVLVGPKGNQLWHDLPNGDLLVDVHGAIAHFKRSADGRTFLFGHDDLVDGMQPIPGVGAAVEDVKRFGNGDFAYFRTGPITWQVEEHDLSLDVYRCVPGVSKRRLTILPRN